MPRTPLLLLIALLTIAAAAPAPARVGQGHAEEFATNALLVAYQPGAALSARIASVNRLALDLDPAVQNPSFARVRIGARARRTGRTLRQALEALRRDPTVRVVEPDYVRTATAIPSDPLFDEQWGLHNRGQSRGNADADMDAPEAWDTTTGSESVRVAVVDTGVDYQHPDLADNVLRAANGAIIGYDFENGDADPMDDNEHGTHCAGNIGARGNNGLGISGVCQRVKIMPLKFLDEKGSGRDSGAIQSIDFAVANGAKVISASWGGPGQSQLLMEAIQRAQSAGVLFVAAAGNGGRDGAGDDTSVTPEYPAAYNTSLSNVVSVAASTRRDTLASFSNYGPTVDLAAPGEQIFSTVLNGQYDSFSGTSMAVPMVAGAAALAYSSRSGLTMAQVRAALLAGTDRPSGIAGRVRSGRLNLVGMLRALGGNTGGTSTYTLRGKVTVGSAAGAGLSGVTITVGNTATTTGADGSYAVTGLNASSYLVRASRAGYAFTPSSLTTNLTADVSGADFVAESTAVLNSLWLFPTRTRSGVVTTGFVRLRSRPEADVVVTLSASDPAVVSVPATVTVPAGEKSASFPISTQAVTSKQRVTVRATLGSVTRTAVLTVKP
jgi:subtilisin family serine protease